MSPTVTARIFPVPAHRVLSFFVAFAFGVLSVVASGSTASGQVASAQDMKTALAKMPSQKGVDVDSVPAADQANCTSEKPDAIYGGKGFIVLDPGGQFVRMYVREGAGSHWTFFKDGQEVYREIDSNGNGRADQYRWMGTAGMRWGLDNNEDGTIDTWKAISAEEVAFEAFEAFRTKDQARFARLALKNADLQQLALGTATQKKVIAEVKALNTKIAQTIGSSSSISRSTEYLNFGGTMPATVPKGKMGLSKDVVIHDNVAAMFKRGDGVASIQLGTLIKVGESWRVAQLPVVTSGESASTNGGLFRLNGAGPPPPPPIDGLLQQFTQADAALKAAKGPALEAAHKKRFDIMLKIIASREDAEKELWVKMLASDASIAYSTEKYSGGKKLLQLLSKSEITSDYHDLFAWELVQVEGANAEDNLALLDAMEEFVTAYPDSENSKEAYRQLGLFSEFDSSPVETSLKWYKELATRFPDTPEAQFAEGAIRRLSSLDKLLDFTGETFTKQKFSLAAYRGKRMVVLHYWSSADELSVADFEDLIALRAKYKDELSVIGVNLDEEMATATGFLKTDQPNARWPHLWAAGGRNSPLALQLGIISVPTTILINKTGEVVENQITVAELDREIYRLKRREK